MSSNISYVEFASGLFIPIAPLSHSSGSFWSLDLTSVPIFLHWQWRFILYTLLACQVGFIAWRFWYQAPSGVFIAAYPTPLGRWITAMRMILDSDTVVQRAYNRANGQPFAVPMLDRWIVFVSDREQLQRLECEPESVLSMEDALHELASTGPILGNLQVPPEHKGPKSESFRVSVGVLKNKLRSSLPAMSEPLAQRIEQAVAQEVAEAKMIERDPEQWHEIRLMPGLLRIFNRVNLLPFFGDEYADHPEVFDRVMGFLWDCTNAFPAVTLTPGFITPFIAYAAMGFGHARQRLYGFILGMTDEGLKRKETGDRKSYGQKGIAQWTVDITRLQDVTVVARIVLGLLFASAFQVPMIVQSCIYQLCSHPEDQDRLYDECLENKDAMYDPRNEDMPYLDSFVKETARLSPGPIISAPRRVMVPYTMPEGCHIPVGNWVAIPQVPLMRDEKMWPRGSNFESFRFVDENGASKSRFTHPSHEFPFWGSIRHACPARFYAATAMKQFLSHMLLDYEFKLADPKAKPFLTFGKVRVPSPFMSILVRKRRVPAGGAEN